MTQIQWAAKIWCEKNDDKQGGRQRERVEKEIDKCAMKYSSKSPRN